MRHRQAEVKENRQRLSEAVEMAMKLIGRIRSSGLGGYG